MSSEQPPLPFGPLEALVDVEYAEGLTISERAACFHAQNPHVLAAVLVMALNLRSRGVRRGGIKMIWEVLRYRHLETHGDKYKLNNSYAPWYAREAMAREPRLEGFFETRASPHDPDYHDRPLR